MEQARTTSVSRYAFAPVMSQIRTQLDVHLTTIADVVRDAVARADTNLATATHEVRKALRRARAVVDLIGDELPGRERRGVRKAIRQARRALGSARDNAVAPQVLALIELADGDRAEALAVIVAAVAATPEEATRRALAEAATYTTEQVLTLHSVLPEDLESWVLVDGVRNVYRKARRARQSAKGRRGFHRWRRRTKELTYQLDLLASVLPSEELVPGIEQLAKAQGEVVDLIMLRGLVYKHDALDKATAARIVAAIDAKLEPLIKETRRAGKTVFARRPRELAKLLAPAETPPS
jgi:CHAD domain-containing protein